MAACLSLNFQAVKFRKFLFLTLIVVCLGCGEQREPSEPAAPPTPAQIEVTPATTEPSEGVPAVEFMDLLSQLDSMKAADRQSLMDQYFAHLPDVPITSGETALFIYRGDASTVQLVGDMNISFLLRFLS